MTSLRLRQESHYDGRMLRCIADRPVSVDELLRTAVARRPDGVAVIAGEVRMTYGELELRVGRLAGHLAATGIGRGERIALLVGNRPEFLLTILAAARLGAIIVPMNVRQRRPEILHMLTNSGAAALVVEESLLEELPDRVELPALRAVWVIGPTTRQAGDRFEALLDQGPVLAQPMTPISEEEAFCILYTSGTTGRPKGAILTHLGIVHSVLHYESALDLREGDVAALAVPASHVTGLVAILLAMLRVAGTTVMMEQFKAESFLAAVERERIGYTLMVPAMYNLCLLHPRLAQFELSNWRVGGFGGAPMPAATIRRLSETIPTLALANLYGATETTSPVSILSAPDMLSHCDTVGRLLPCADVVVVDERGRELPAGELGELLIAGPMVIPGYWEDPKADAAAFTGGYWRSGDIGSLDVDGYLRIHDRMKDVINRGGYKIYCVEVEHVIAEHPAVLECAVLGYPDHVLGERVQAVVSTFAGSDVTSDQLRAFCASRLSDYKVPERMAIFTTPLPRNANGKILKAELRRSAELAVNPTPRTFDHLA